jgi:hypothetical protein
METLSEQKKCPVCAELIPAAALKCNYCGAWIESGAKTAESPQGIPGSPFLTTSAQPQKPVLQTFRRYPELFNRRLFGINYYVGGAFFVSAVLSIFIWPLVYALSNGFHSFFYPFQYYLIQIPFDVLGAAVFLFISHLVLKDWILPLLFGLANVLIHIVRLLMLNAIPMEGIRFIKPFDLGGLIGSFSWSFLFFCGLVLAVRLFGPKIWSLMLGSASAYLLSALINPLLYMSSGAKYSLDVQGPVAAFSLPS